MKFKTYLQDLRNVQLVINSISNTGILVDGATGLLNQNSLNSLKTAISGLSKEQALLVLSTKNLSKAQTEQVLSAAGLLGVERQLTTSKMSEMLATQLNSKSEAEALLINSGLITQKELEENATIKVTVAKINEAVANGTLSASDASVIAGALGITGVNTGETISFDLLTASIWANIKALGAWLVTNPVGWAILGGTAIFGLVKAYDALTDSVEEVRERTDALLETYNSAISEANSNAQTIESLASRYEKLSKGVNNLGENVSLTADEYSEYNDIVNQIADMFPTLIQGYTNEGDAILSLKGNVEELRNAYKEAQEEAYNLLIASGKNSDGNDILKDANNVINNVKTGDWFGKGSTPGGNKETIDYIDKISNIFSKDNYKDIILGKTGLGTPLDPSDDDKTFRKWFTYLTGIPTDGSKYISDITDEQVAEILNKLKISKQTLNAEINSVVDNVETIANAYLMTNEDYEKLDDQSKNATSMIVNSLNADTVSSFGENKENVGKYVDSIVETILNNQDAKDAIIGLFTMDTTDMSISDIEQQINGYINTISGILGENPAELKVRLGFDDSDTQPLINNVREKLQDEFDDKVGELTLEDLQIAAEQIEVPEGTLLSWDELMSKIEDIKNGVSNLEIKPFTDQFKELWDSDAFEDSRKDLEKLAKEAGIAGSDIQSLAAENETLASLLDETGMSAQFAATCFNRVCDGADGFSAITDDALALDKVLHEMDGSLQQVAASKSEYDKAMEKDDYNAEFKDYQEAYASAMEMFENGDYGRHFRSTMEYLLGDDSFNMSIEEMYESMKDLKSIFGEKSTNGLEFLDRLYSKKDILDGLNSTLEKASDGSYVADFKPEEFEKIGDAMGMTAEEVSACVNALGMFGDFVMYDIDKLNDALKEMAVSAEDGGKSLLSLQGVETMLSNLGYTGYEASRILEDIKKMDGIKLLDFGSDSQKEIDGIISKLRELDMVEISGKNITIDSLISSLRDDFNMASVDIEAFVRKANNSFNFSDAEGKTLSLKEAIQKVQESDDSTSEDSMESLGKKTKETDKNVKELNNESLSKIREEFRVLGNGVGVVGDKLNGLLKTMGNMNNVKFNTETATPTDLPGSVPTMNQGTLKTKKKSPEKKGVSHATGTGGIGVPKNETALINELGNETIIDPKSGQYEIVEGGAQFRKLKKGQIILNHIQTKALKMRGKISSFGEMVSGGIGNLKGRLKGKSYAEGTVGSHNPAIGNAWGSNKNSNKNGNSNSGSDSSKEPSIEIFDFIEILISRIEAATERLKSKAEETFTALKTRANAYNKAVAKVTEEINIQSRAYDAYMAKANSIGLEAAYAAQVRDGSINIDEVSDDGLKERIKNYQEWWITPPCPVMGM